MRISVFPYYVDNPYLDMLYADARERGACIQASTELTETLHTYADLSAGDVVHLHWTTPIAQPFPSEREAARSVRAFQQAVRRAQRRGARFVWTIHNLSPHEMPYPRLERHLTKWILRHADDVIVLTRSTTREFRIPPRKTRLLTHSSYLGVYPDTVSDADARASLGVGPSTPVIGFVGEQRPYKGIPELIAAFSEYRRSHADAQLLLGGRVRHQDEAAMDELVAPVGGILRSDGRVANEDLQRWFRACDFMVFPYRRVLNSGSMFLSATFSRPCVLPGTAAMVDEWGAQEWIEFYDPESDPVTSIAGAMKRISARLPHARAAARAFAEGNTPQMMSLRYSELIGLRSPSTPCTKRSKGGLHRTPQR